MISPDTSQNMHTRGGLSVTLLAISMLTIMVGSILAPALPDIAGRVGMAAYPSLLITLPALGVIISAPFAGRLIDAFGGRTILLIGLILYGGLGLLGACLNTLIFMAADRFLLGIATAFIMASGTSLIADHFRGDKRLKMIAQQGMAIEIGGIIFLSLSGVLAGIFWKLPFGLYLLAWLYILPVLAYVPKAAGQPKSVTLNAAPKKFKAEKSLFAIATSSMLLFFAAFITLPHVMSAAGYTEADIGIYLGAVSLIAVISAGGMPMLRRRISSSIIFALAFGAYGGAHFLYGLGASPLILALSGIAAGTGFGLTIPLCNYEVLSRSSKLNRNRNLAYLSSAIFLGQVLSSGVDILKLSPAVIFEIMMYLSLGIAMSILLLLITRIRT